MRSFRDLEVYAKSLECAVTVTSVVKRATPDFFALEGMMQCALSVPLLVAESHSLRFADKKGSIMLLERAMAGCNKMVVYLEEAVGIYGCPGADIDPALSPEPKEKKGNEGKRKDAKGKDNIGTGRPRAEVAMAPAAPVPGTGQSGTLGIGMLNPDLVNDLITKYLDVRGKMFRLEQSWKKWDNEHAPTPA